MASKKVNYDKALGFEQNESHRQQDIYFGLISDSEELKSSTGKQMAEVARMMARKNYMVIMSAAESLNAGKGHKKSLDRSRGEANSFAEFSSTIVEISSL